MKGLLYLGIETSGKIASAAICDENGVIAETTLVTRLTHSQVILPMVKRLFDDADIDMKDIGCIAVANGPGSYTGIRIGVAAVKGMCMSLGCKCCGVSSLEELACNVSASDATVLSVLKARKDVVYFGAFRVHYGDIERMCSDTVCSVEDVRRFAKKISGVILVVGDCCEEIKNRCLYDNYLARIAPLKDRMHNAASVCFLAMRKRKYPADKLEAVYLQNTKAEKDKAHSN